MGERRLWLVARARVTLAVALVLWAMTTSWAPAQLPGPTSTTSTTTTEPTTTTDPPPSSSTTTSVGSTTTSSTTSTTGPTSSSSSSTTTVAVTTSRPTSSSLPVTTASTVPPTVAPGAPTTTLVLDPLRALDQETPKLGPVIFLWIVGIVGTAAMLATSWWRSRGAGGGGEAG